MARLRQFKTLTLSAVQSGISADVGPNVLVKSNAAGNDLEASDLKELVSTISTSKTLQAKKVQAAEKTIELGPALALSASGGEILWRDSSASTETQHYSPRKQFDVTNGTAGAFTQGRVVSAFSRTVLVPLFSLRSDDPTAAVGVNNVAGKVIFTSTPTVDVLDARFYLRFATAQTGIRLVIRLNNGSGRVVFESEAPWVWNANQGGQTSVVYAGTPATEFVLDMSENPQLFLAGQTYHVTVESYSGAVVMLGGLISGEYKPFIDRDVATVIKDPVVARGEETITAAQTFDAQDWYETKYLSGTFAVRLPPLASSAGLDLILINVGAGVITVNDNAGVNVDALVAGETGIYESDGTTIRRINRAQMAEVVALAETIAGVESRLDAVEALDSADQASEAALYASLASLAAKVESLRLPIDDGIKAALAALATRFDALRLPVDDGIKAALAALSAKHDALQVPVADGLEAALASLSARVAALDIPADSPLHAALASVREVLDRHDNRLELSETDRAALAESMAGVEARLTAAEEDNAVSDPAIAAAMVSLASKVEALDIPSATPVESAVASLHAGGEEERQHREDDGQALAETVAGIESELAAQAVVQSIQHSGFTLTAASGVTQDVTGSDITLAPGRHIVTYSGASLIESAVVGDFVGIDVWLRNVTAGVDLTSQRAGGHEMTSFVAAPFCFVWSLNLTVTTVVRLQTRRGFTSTPVSSLLSGSNTIIAQRVG